MGTHCYIAKEIDGKKYESIYCQLDGYPEEVGKLLVEHYGTPEKLDSLLTLGDIYSLREKTTPDPDRPHNADQSFQRDVTVAYGRDFGAPDCSAKVRSIDEMTDNDEGIEFLYIFTAEHEWEFSPLLDYDSSFRKVRDVLYRETCDINMDNHVPPMKDDQADHRQYLIDTILNYMEEHHDSSRLYEMLHEEMGFSNEDIMNLGFDLSEHWVYEWESEDIQRHYAERLDSVLPQHDVLTTTAWINFAKELAVGTETSFEAEAKLLVTAFKEISERYSPKVVAEVYATIHIPDNALLANEIIAAAKFAEQGLSAQELSDMAERGEFDGEPYPKQSRADEEKVGGMNEMTSM